MSAIQLISLGIHAEHCPNKAGLGLSLVSQFDTNYLVEDAPFRQANVRLISAADKLLSREDRPFLNEISISIINAIQDLCDSLPDEHRQGNFLNLPLYLGTDSAEHSFSSLDRIANGENCSSTIYERLGSIKSIANPLDVLRLISTNSVYHVSKKLLSHGGGYPIRAMSMSGLCALEDAVTTLKHGAAENCDMAAVVAAGNMRSFEALVAFGKLGILSQSEASNRGIHPSWGSVALLLSRRYTGDSKHILADILDVQSFFIPEAYAHSETWRSMLGHVRNCHGSPDFIICYANGSEQLERSEAEALDSEFEAVPRLRYKSIFGYTGKANTLLDLSAAIADPNIPTGATILINGTGLGYGVGYVLLRKMTHLH